jgi:hypothetical protein
MQRISTVGRRSYAAYGGHEAAVKLLLEISKVEVDVKDEYGRTPL